MKDGLGIQHTVSQAHRSIALWERPSFAAREEATGWHPGTQL